MIIQKESKQVRMDSWSLKPLSRDMKKTKTKTKEQPTKIIKDNRKIKAMVKITSTHEPLSQNRWEILILNLLCHLNPGNE